MVRNRRGIGIPVPISTTPRSTWQQLSNASASAAQGFTRVLINTQVMTPSPAAVPTAAVPSGERWTVNRLATTFDTKGGAATYRATFYVGDPSLGVVLVDIPSASQVNSGFVKSASFIPAQPLVLNSGEYITAVWTRTVTSEEGNGVTAITVVSQYLREREVSPYDISGH